MTTFQIAAAEYLTKITPTHTPSTMRTYHRNFEVVLTPYFGADTPLESVTGEQVAAFHASDVLLRKPNGQPRAEPTKNQITGLLRSFLTHAATNGLMPAMAEMPARSRKTVVRLCDRCRAPLTAVEPPSAPPLAPPSTEPEAPATVTAPLKATTKSATPAKAHRPKASVKAQSTSKPAKRRARK